MIIILILILIIIIILDRNKIIYENFQEYKYPIKEVKPDLIINENSDICFIFFYTKNIEDYAKHSLHNVKNYCNKHGYALQSFSEKFNDEVYPCWNKVCSILKLLPKYKYIVWIDCDAIIVNFDKKIEHFINKDPSKDIYMCHDIDINKECINSGVLIIKNTDWTNKLFKKVWNSETPHTHNDQNVLLDEIIKDIFPNDELLKHKVMINLNTDEKLFKYKNYCHKELHPKVAIFPENDFNTHIFNYKDGDFIIHLMGTGTNSRINIMRQINTKLGIDNYHDNKCIELIKQDNCHDRIRKTRKTCYTIDDQEYHKDLY